MGVLARLGEFGVVPVVVIEREDDAVNLGRALLEGGLPCAEITFRTAAAEEAVHRIASQVPDVLVGAGTVLTVEQAERAVGAGARFIVSPGFDRDLVDWCLAREVAVTPGAITPTEVMMALRAGLNVLKFFPVDAMGGIQVLKAIGAPFPQVRFIPTGGISAANLADYLSLPMVHACGGSWLVKRSLITSGNFSEITRLAREAVEMVSRVRGREN